MRVPNATPEPSGMSLCSLHWPCCLPSAVAGSSPGDHLHSSRCGLRRPGTTLPPLPPTCSQPAPPRCPSFPCASLLLPPYARSRGVVREPGCARTARGGIVRERDACEKKALTLRLEDTEDLGASDRLDLCDTVGVTEHDTDLRRGHALLRHCLCRHVVGSILSVKEQFMAVP